MNHKLIAAGMITITATIIGFYPNHNNDANAKTVLLQQIEKPKIQIAILLDTSSSMSGLINQTRSQLWQVVNEFTRANKNGITPSLEVAVYEYGNNQLSSDNGFIRQITPLTGELDQVSEALFSLTTNGGNEYCGAVINTAVQELNWSTSNSDIKTIFIAGNEPFSQGPIAFSQAIAAAKSKGITVNTIHAGNDQTGINTGWQQGALLAGGDYMSIDHNHRVAHINAPQDDEIQILNQKLNSTYVPYGKEGAAKIQRQAKQDEKNKAVSPALMVKRARSKASSLYDNSSWDLVDAVDSGKINVESLQESQLPSPMKKLSEKERKVYIKAKTTERRDIQQKIKALSQKRSEYVKEKKREAKSPSAITVNDAVSASIRKQGELKNYVFESK